MLNHFRPVFLTFLELPRYVKRIIAISVDVSLCFITVWLALSIRLGEFARLTDETILASLITISIAVPVFISMGLYRAIFRYSGWPAIFTVARAIFVYAILYISIIAIIDIPGIPKTIGLIHPFLLFFTIGGTRALARYWLGGIYHRQFPTSSLPKALIYGAGNAGLQLVAALHNSHEIRVIGFLDDDIRLHGHSLNGQSVYSPNDLDELIKTKDVTHILLAIPSASRARRNEILNSISRHHVAVRTLPSLTDLAEGRVTVSDLQDLDIDDLLGRTPVTPNQILLTKAITGEVVMVTGAGGSIGSELCRQIIKLTPAKLILLDVSEFVLYSIHSELEYLQSIDPHHISSQIIPLLASVQNESRMRAIIETWKPDTVYHAAAYKHVPLVEYNLSEGIKNNVFGTLTTAKIAQRCGVSNFVLISTDKAVRPTNVMGASKRLAELCLQALFAHLPEKSTTKFSIVRFGNVLDSSGSVIPKFRKQIRDGGPITLTHKDITRYFMTIPEAALLVIQAGAMAKGGEVFVLDMGQPVKISDLAMRMIELSGLTLRNENNPDGDIEIIITGLRPGEKLYEEPLYGDTPMPTHHHKISQAHDPFIPWHTLDTEISELYYILQNNDVSQILNKLNHLVSGFNHNGEIVDSLYTEKHKLPYHHHNHIEQKIDSSPPESIDVRTPM